MIAYTDSEMVRFLGSYDSLELVDRRIYFVDQQASSIRIDLRVKEPHQLLYLARLIAHLGYEETDFSGAYLWITAWDLWNRQVEALTFKTLEQFRRAYGENRSLETAPACNFRQDEFVDSVCCLVQPMIVGWDAYYIPSWSYGVLNYFVWVSHDSFIDIIVRTEEMAAKATKVLESHDWIKPLIKK